jgi:ubiquitin carboxyl-terminal hydrolase 8
MTGKCQWNCPQCKVHRDAEKKIDIWKLPPLLIIHFKRFKYQGVWRDKITTNIDFPIENLKLDKYILNGEARSQLKNTYRLYAISNHSGTLDGGHYTAMCRNYELNRWLKFDDTDVKEVNTTSIISPLAYILFYTRI